MFSKKFISKCYNNLDSNKIFYRYFEEQKKYRDLKIFFQKFKSIVKKERLKIVTFSDKSFEMYASIASIFFSNNIWIPLSLNVPLDRLKKILAISKPHLIITADNFTYLSNKKFKIFCKKNNIKVIQYKTINNSIAQKKFFFPQIDFKKLSMIFFTSGSTGDPKGVCITYKNFITCFKSKEKILYNNDKNLVFGDYHDPSFVISLVIFFPCLYLGGTISPSRNMFETLNPVRHLFDNRINTLITVPSTIVRIKENKIIGKYFKFVNKIIMCGEPFRLSLASFIFKKIKPKELFNFYGSTEVGPWIFYHKLKFGDVKKYSNFDFVPVGKPLNNVEIKILKKELFVAGPMVSPGYLQKKQNKNIFLKKGKKLWYRTKDQITLYKNKYFIKGRIDKMVKIQGYRVDIGDIESNIRKIKKIDDVVVYLKEGKSKKFLSCAIKTSKKIDKIEIIKKISKKVPNYMIPQKIYLYKNFPMNRSGKIDRKKIMI